MKGLLEDAETNLSRPNSWRIIIIILILLDQKYLKMDIYPEIQKKVHVPLKFQILPGLLCYTKLTNLHEIYKEWFNMPFWCSSQSYKADKRKA
jgi:hypothetical protein